MIRQILSTIAVGLLLGGLLLLAITPPSIGQESVIRLAPHTGGGSGIPRTLDPFDQQGRQQADLENVYEPLVYPHRDTFDIRGVLAESWTSTDGGAVWTFKLRRGVKFHDGSDLTADAVKLSFERDRAVNRSAASSLLTDVREVRVVDPLTVQFVLRLAGGPPFLPRMTSLLVASAKALREHANEPNWFRDKEAGSGPYMVEEFVARDRMTLRRFDGYWGQKPFFSKAIVLTVLEPASQALMIERGEVDIAYNLPPQSFTQMKQNPQLRVIQVPGDRVLNFRLNVHHGPFAKLAFRKAVAHAMDYDALQRARSDEISPSEGPVPKQYMNGWLPPNLITKQNLDRARQLLTEAGYRPGEVEVTFNISAGTPRNVTAAEILQANLGKIGVKANIKIVDFAPMFTKLQRFARTKNPADAEDTMTLVRGPFVPHPHAYFSSYESGGQSNFMGYENKRVHELFELGYAVERRDADRAQEYYRRAVQLIVDDQPDVWFHVEKRVVVMRRDVQGYYMHPIWYPQTHVFPLSRR
jgi:peptide/nickel transport system substrate-binding protein